MKSWANHVPIFENRDASYTRFATFRIPFYKCHYFFTFLVFFPQLQAETFLQMELMQINDPNVNSSGSMINNLNLELNFFIKNKLFLYLARFLLLETSGQTRLNNRSEKTTGNTAEINN
uniref:Uncharacterized protein n=1 Tax=Glossina brevipalpis TaxID=37001 RepID=A0A1A9WCP6_9MUSC